ncbi:MAG: histidine kinase [Candidatus Aminicenantes bacterium]|nr:histidine kinase [Candidatus Aminicenantes bacterium]
MKFRHRRIWLPTALLVLIFTLLSAVMTLQSYMLAREAKFPFDIRNFFFQLGTWLPWAAFAPLIFAVEKRIRTAAGRWYVKAAFHLAAAIVILTAHGLLTGFLLRELKILLEAAGRVRGLIVFGSFGMRIPVYGAILGAGLAWDYYRQFRERALAAAELKAQLAQAQLQALKSQIHPHFLFNTLNTVAALVHEDPDAADRIISRLSGLLRSTLENQGRQEVPLKEEVEFLAIYLDILETRFGDQISFRVEIEPAAGGALVPSFLLQPLVENAVRHGLASRREGGVVSIRASRLGATLRLEVSDNGPGFGGDPESLVRQGFGLANVRERLTLLYGRDGGLTLENAGGASIKISIPFRDSPSSG